LLSNWRNK